MRAIRRSAQALALAALVLAASGVAASAAPAGNKWQASTASFEQAVLAERALVRAMGMQVSGDFIYGHNPGGGDYALKGAYPSGAVLEARGYFVEGGDGKVRSVVVARTRRGGASVQSDWNLGGSNSSTYSEYLSYTTGFTYGHREDYGDVIGASFVTIQSFNDCSTVAGTDRYQGGTFAFTANPAGSDPVSGSKDQATAFQDNNIMDCGEQA